MKILHTSDWHLGHCLYNYDRTEEQTSMLNQIVEIAEREQPDLFLVSGDVYHTSQPSAAVQKMFADTMVRLYKACPGTEIVVTSGNHDSASKHEIFQTPWLALNVHAIGTIDREQMENHIIEIPGKGYVVAVPYCYKRNLPEGFFQNLLDEVAKRNTQNLPVVLSAHTTVQGCDLSGHEHSSDFMVGGIDTFSIDQLGSGYDYLALGHIHHAQFIHTGKHNVRYSGTPLAVSFDEDYSHTISIVTIEKHGDAPDVKEVEITNPRQLVTLPKEGTVTWEEAKQMLRDFPSDEPCYIRLNVRVNDFLPSQANAEAGKIISEGGKKCRFCHIKVSRPEIEHDENTTLSIDDFYRATPIDILSKYAKGKGIEIDADLQALFNEALMAMEDDEND